MKHIAAVGILFLSATSAQAIEPYRSQDIQPYQAETVKPYQSDTVVPSLPAEEPGRDQIRRKGEPVQETQQTRKHAVPAVAAAELVGLWQTNVPGAVYTTPSSTPGYDVLHVSPGATAGLLRINADGTYAWNSYGGKKGKWVVSTDPEYPIVIIDTVENRRWRVGYNGAKRTLFVWDGSIWYEGRRAQMKR